MLNERRVNVGQGTMIYRRREGGVITRELVAGGTVVIAEHKVVMGLEEVTRLLGGASHAA